MYREREAKRRGIFLALILLTGSAHPDGVTAEKPGSSIEAQLIVDHVCHRFVHPQDKGRTQVFFRNDTHSSVSITEVLVNGEPLPSPYPWLGANQAATAAKREEDQTVLWARVSPNPVPPGGLSEVFVLWAKRAEEPIELQAKTKGGSELSVLIPVEAEQPLRIMAIRFSPDHRRVFLYVKNLGKVTLVLEDAFLSGLDATAETFVGPGVLLGRADTTTRGLREIKPHEIKCIMVSCRRPLNDGALVFAKIVANNAADEAWARVYTEFPFGPKFTEERFYLEYDHGASELATGRHEIPRFVKLEHCLTHRPQGLSWSQRARAALAAHHSCHNRCSGSLTLIHLCKIRLEGGMLAFAPITDSIMTNTNESEVRSATRVQNDLETATQRLSRFVSRACAPRPWFQIVILERDERFLEFRKRMPGGPETRARMYWAISSGCHGLCYRGFSGELRSDLQRTLSTIQLELGQVSNLLPYAYPVLTGQCSDPQVEVSVLQAGYDALLLIVINHDFHHQLTPDIERAAAWRPKGDLAIRVAVPAGLAVDKAFWIHGRQQDTLSFSSRGREAAFSLPRLLQAELVLLPLDAQTPHSAPLSSSRRTEAPDAP